MRLHSFYVMLSQVKKVYKSVGVGSANALKR